MLKKCVQFEFDSLVISNSLQRNSEIWQKLGFDSSKVPNLILQFKEAIGLTEETWDIRYEFPSAELINTGKEEAIEELTDQFSRLKTID